MKITLKRSIESIPFARDLYYWLKRFRRSSIKHLGAEELFTRYHRENFWSDRESVSGSGSNTANTRKLIVELRPMLDLLGIASVVDIPCGDFYWMSQVNLNGVHYIGGDVVKGLTSSLHEKHGNATVEFQHLNLLQDSLPAASLILCRDGLVHFSYRDIRKALEAIKSSGARYLATTHFPAAKKNFDIVTGDWRRLNFTKAPFYWPEPDQSITEGSIEGDGQFADKTLSFWRIGHLPPLGKS